MNSIILCGILILLPLKSETTENEALSKRVIFYKESQILLAEKFVNVQFLVPFPKYNFTMRKQVKDMLTKLAEMWSQPSAECP